MRAWVKNGKRALVVLGVGLLFILSQLSFFIPLLRAGGPAYDSWNLFHYVLNARYYTELRYNDLYACAIEADREGQHFYAKDSLVRELRDYSPTVVSAYRPCPRERFTAERWQQFVKDLVQLQQLPILFDQEYRGNVISYWNAMLSDKGYNLPPTQVVLSQFALRSTDSFGVFQIPFIMFLDLLFLGLAFIQVKKVFGARSMIAAILFLSWFWGTQGFILGLFLQHLWLAFVLFGVCALKRERFVWSGIWLALATMTRIFPIFLVVPFIPIFVRSWYVKDSRTLDQLKLFFRGFAFTCAALFLLSLASGLGFEGGIVFAQKIQLHAHSIVGEVFDIGFKNLIATAAGSMANDANRLAFFARFKIIWFVVSLLSSIFLLWRIRNTRPQNAIVFGLPLFYFWTVTSPYYWLILVLIPIHLLSPRTENNSAHALQAKEKIALVGLTSLLLIHLVLGWSGISYYVQMVQLHLVSEGLIAGYLFVLMWAILPRSSETTSVTPTHDAVSISLRT